MEYPSCASINESCMANRKTSQGVILHLGQAHTHTYHWGVSRTLRLSSFHVFNLAEKVQISPHPSLSLYNLMATRRGCWSRVAISCFPSPRRVLSFHTYLKITLQSVWWSGDRRSGKMSNCDCATRIHAAMTATHYQKNAHRRQCNYYWISLSPAAVVGEIC